MNRNPLRQLSSKRAAIALCAVCFAWVAVGAAGSATRWSESFARWPGDWESPRQSNAEIHQVFEVLRQGDVSFLRADHDARSGREEIPPAVHFGHAFRRPQVRLASACILEWKWRVLQHPAATDDAWLDVAASVYVLTESPGLFSEGRGFKFGWLQKPGARGEDQRGILQIELRRDPTGSAFESERVDLCELHEQYFGPVADEMLLYVGVVTDADGTESRARADYRDFRLRGSG